MECVARKIVPHGHVTPWWRHDDSSDDLIVIENIDQNWWSHQNLITLSNCKTLINYSRIFPITNHVKDYPLRKALKGF